MQAANPARKSSFRRDIAAGWRQKLARAALRLVTSDSDDARDTDIYVIGLLRVPRHGDFD
jgi:hypothetical protein